MAIQAFQLVVVALIILLATLLWMTYSRKYRNMPPGPRGWPIVGSLMSLSQDEPFVDMMKLGKKYGGRGDIVTLQLGSTTVVVLNTYEAIKEAMIKKAEYFSSRPASPLFDELAQRKGITCAPYSKAWKEQRTFVLKTFRKLGMENKSLEGKISNEISFLFDEIIKFKGQPFDSYEILNSSASNIIFIFIKGERFDYQDSQFKLLLQHFNLFFKACGPATLYNLLPILSYIPFLNAITERPINSIRNFKNFVKNLFLHLIEEHRQELHKDNIRSFIDAYLVEVERTKNVPDSSFQDIDNFIMSIVDLFMGGTDTTSTTLYWIILYLITYPDIQKQVQQEIDRMVGRDRLPTLADEPQLPFTRAVIRETQRLATLGPLGFPHSVSADTQLMGYNIPKDTQIFTNLWAVHHDPKIWDEPHTFKPSRFIDSTGNIISKPDELMAFSTGRRQCPGEQLAKIEVFLYTACLFHRFSFLTPEGAPAPSLKGKNGITFSPQPYNIVARDRYI